MADLIAIENPVELSKDLVLAYKPQTFLRRMCSTITHRTASFLIDVQKKTRQAAPYVCDDDDATYIARDGYETHQFKPVPVKPSRNITSRDVEKRMVGQNIVEISAENANQEATSTGIEIADLLDLQDSIERREEQQIAEILTTGKLVTGVSADINAPIPESHIFAAASADKFDAVGSDPLKFLRNVNSKKIVKDGGSAAKYAIFGGDAFDAFIANASVKDFLDNRRIEFGNVNPTPDQEFPGVVYQGRILGMDVYTYDEYYFDSKTKSEKAIIPADRVILIGGQSRFEMHYAAIYDGARGTINKTQTYAYTWVEKGKTKWLELESKPLFVPVNGGAIVSAKVL